MKIALLLLLLGAACSGEKKAAPAEPVTASDNIVTLSVTEKGFEPGRVKVKGGAPVKLVVTRKTDKTCATELVVPGHGIKTALPLNEPVEIAFTPARTGELKYGCGMDQMISGVLIVE